MIKSILTKEQLNTAVTLARQVRKWAYAPYSKYTVGAVAVAQSPVDGFIAYFAGVNVENASYGLTMCAERVAIYNAMANGFSNIIAIAISTTDGGISCGACRQVEYEFNKDMEIIAIDDNNNIEIINLQKLLPHAFSLEQKDEKEDE